MRPENGVVEVFRIGGFTVVISVLASWIESCVITTVINMLQLEVCISMTAWFLLVYTLYTIQSCKPGIRFCPLFVYFLMWGGKVDITHLNTGTANLYNNITFKIKFILKILAGSIYPLDIVGCIQVCLDTLSHEVSKYECSHCQLVLRYRTCTVFP